MFGNKEKDRTYDTPKASEPTPTPAAKPAAPAPTPAPAPVSTPSPSPMATHKDRTVIGPGAKFTGNLEIDGTLEVNGELEGTVTCSETLVVGPNGKLKAEIEVRDATISGRVDGKIHARERVELAAGSHFTGDVHSKSFMIQDGVYFEGNCSMGDTSKAKDSSSPSGKHDSGKNDGDKPDIGIVKQA